MTPGDDPFASAFTATAPAPASGGDPFDEAFSGGAPYHGSQLDTAQGRALANYQNIVDNLAALRKIRPANEGHAKRLQKRIAQLEQGLKGIEHEDQGVTENFLRGIGQGLSTGLYSVADLGVGLGNLVGQHDLVKPLHDWSAEKQGLIREVFQPEGKAGTAGEIVGGIASTALPYGEGATLVGKGIARIAPATKLAEAIKAGQAAGLAGRVTTNVLTGLPLNVLQATAADQEVPTDASPEQQQAIRDANFKNRLKNLAIGIGADAAFGAAIKQGRVQEIKDAAAGVKAKFTGEPASPLNPVRESQLAQMQATANARLAEQADAKKLKGRAMAEWIRNNPDGEWQDLTGKQKRKVYDAYKESLDKPTDFQTQNAAMDERLKRVEAQRDEALRLAETDHLLDVGNRRMLEKASKSADKDPNLAYIFADANGFKGLNDALGMQVGDQFLRDARDVVVNALDQAGAPKRVFRFGGDELVAIVPKDAAESIRDAIEKASIKDYGQGNKGSLSGGVFDTLDEALSVQGKSHIASRKLEAKAAQGIPGRDAEEQSLINAILERKATEAQGIENPIPDGAGAADAATSAPVVGEPGVAPGGSVGGAGPELGAGPQLPPEVEFAVSQIQQAGGLQTPEAHASFLEDYGKVRQAARTPEEYAQQMQELIEDYTPYAPEQTPGSLEAAQSQGPAISPDQPQLTPGAEGTPGAVPTQAPTPTGSPEGAPAPSSTFLNTVEHSKSLETMTEAQRTKIEDHLMSQMEDLDPNSVEYSILQSDLQKLGDVQAIENAMKGVGGPGEPSPLPEGLKIRPDYNPNEIVRVQRPVAVEPAPPDVSKKLFNQSLRKLGDPDLETHIQDIRARLEDPSLDLDTRETIEGRLDKALEERAFRDRAANGPVDSMAAHAALQAGTGFGFGFLTPPSDDPQEKQDRITNGFMWGLAAVAGGTLAAKMYARSRGANIKEYPSQHWPGSAAADKVIVSRLANEPKPKPWLARTREWYEGLVRRSYSIERATEALGGKNLPAQRNPGKLASMFGRWVSMSEAALMDAPVVMDAAGNVQQLDAPSYRHIIEGIDGDIEGLGKLMAARASIEGAGSRRVPFDPVTAELIYRNAPENYHAAADAMRQFDLAMAYVMEHSQVLQPGTVARFASEDFYAAMHRVFGEGESPKLSKSADGTIQISAPNPIKGRKGGTQGQIFNPAETTISMVPKIYRAAELNTVKNTLVDLWEAAGRPDGILKLVERRKLPMTPEQELRVSALRQELKGLSPEEAQSMVSAFDEKSLDPTSATMSVFRDGVLKSYRIDTDVARSIQSLTPEELAGYWKVLGLPAQLGRAGVVYNPFFVAKQALIDAWQATLNSKYGFRFGIDNARGWWNIVKHSPDYKNFLGGGGGHSTLQSHDFVNVRTAEAAIRRGGGGPLETALKQVRELHPIEAYKTLIVPFAEAARVGEYMRGLDHGASVADAIMAAKEVTGNFGQRGGFELMRGLNAITMFLNPSIQALDQAATRAGIHPFRTPEEGRAVAGARYLTKAFLSIGLPSWYLWNLNKDDQEITDLRGTESGKKYWFVRSPVNALGIKQGDIIKIPKPIGDGQLFGSTIEAMLDQQYGLDPRSMQTTASTTAKDFAFNMLPTIGVIPISLGAGQNWDTGAPLVPGSDQQLELQYQGADKASWLGRTVSQQLGPRFQDSKIESLRNAATPAGFDYIVSSVGGMLGQDGLKALSQIVDSQKIGYVPAKEEYPIISRVFADYPSMQVGPIREFYDVAEKTQVVAATVNHLIEKDPGELARYMNRHKPEIAAAAVMASTRQDIANFRRAYADVKNVPGISSEDRRLYQKKFMSLMIERARAANTVARRIYELSDQQNQQ